MSHFNYGNDVSITDVCLRLSDRVRFERKRQGYTQAEFAALCNIPLRSYKRFEAGRSNSLETFVRVIIEFGRVQAFELLFPPRAAEPRDAVSRLDRLMRRIGEAE